MKKTFCTIVLLVIIIGIVSTTFAAESAKLKSVSETVILNGFLDYNGHEVTIWNRHHTSMIDNVGTIVGDINSKTKIIIADRVASVVDLIPYNWKRVTIRTMFHIVDTKGGKKFICDNIYILSHK